MTQDRASGAAAGRWGKQKARARQTLGATKPAGNSNDDQVRYPCESPMPRADGAGGQSSRQRPISFRQRYSDTISGFPQISRRSFARCIFVPYVFQR